MYKMDESWSKDKTRCYYEGTRMRFAMPMVKGCVVVLFGLALSQVLHYSIAILICILVQAFYQDVVAAVLGLHSLPVMDYTCFIGSEKAVVNFMNCTWYATACDPELVKDKLIKAARIMPKLRYKLVEVGGDYYYEEMSEEEMIQKGLIHNKEG